MCSVSPHSKLTEEAKMRMNLRRKSVLAAVALTALAAPITSTGRGDRDDRDDVTTYRARLSGFGEVPPKLLSISWTLTWTELTTPAQAAHIHFGQPQNTGSVVVFFCGGGGRPACPDGPGHSGSVSGTWTAADILPVAAQNVAAGDFAGFVRILRVNLGYANIHTTIFPGGEIRGQVSHERDRDDDH
ncbi:MAG: CHRD domain-containing protein [Betaproteobacteria bacterium]|nr:MAG: CHRD domain-containing protein [Betaproteobacteria bacterium]